MIDVDVQYADGDAPAVYTIMEMHTPVDIERPDDSESGDLL